MRELENFIHGACTLSNGRQLEVPSGLISGPRTIQRSTSPQHRLFDAFACTFQAAKAHVIADFERAYLTQLIERSGGNVTRAAALCGKERRTLGKLLKKHGLTA